jgi:class I fructose-bisphosphate aldolase
MTLGKQIRLNRLFAHPSGNLCSVAADHFFGYHHQGLPAGLINLPETIARLVEGRPDAITLMKGAAISCWGPHAGKIPLIISSICFTPDDTHREKIAQPEEALLLGADAIAVAIGVRGPNEGWYIRQLSDSVEAAAKINLPVMAHIYPRDFSGTPKIVHDPENILWAVRCGIECGADVIKVPYTGDVASYRDIAAICPVPLVAAGGPKADTLEAALQMIWEVMQAGARGATIGRNIWGFPDIAGALHAFKAIIHDRASVQEALRLVRM